MADLTDTGPTKKPDKDIIVTMDNADQVEAEYAKEILAALKESLNDRMHTVLHLLSENTAQNIMLTTKKKLSRQDILDALNNTVSGGDTTYDETLDECDCDDDIAETTVDYDGDNDADDNVSDNDPTGKGKVKQRTQALDAEEKASGPIYDGINNSTVMEDRILLEARRVVIKVNAKGKRRRKIVCGKGKKLVGTSCRTQTGKEKQTRKIAIRKRKRTLKREGASARRKANRLRARALKKRKSMGLRV